METNPFELLGLERSTATRATIVAAYRERAALYHPDRKTGDAAKFDAVRKARDECIELIDQPLPKVRCTQCKGTGRWHKSHGWGLIEMMCDRCEGGGYD